MNIKGLLTNKFMLVRMDEIKISSYDLPIIATQALVSCISFILHSSQNKKTILGHISTDKISNESGIIDIIININKLIKENGLEDSFFDLYLIPGAIESKQKFYSYDLKIIDSKEIKKYNSLELLELILTNIKTIKINRIIKNNFPNNAFQLVDYEGNITNIYNSEVSKQYAFDSRIGNFVTNKVLFKKIDVENKMKKL